MTMAQPHIVGDELVEDMADEGAPQDRPEELRLIEALLFAAGEPLDEKTLRSRLPEGVIAGILRIVRRTLINPLQDRPIVGVIGDAVVGIRIDHGAYATRQIIHRLRHVGAPVPG